MVGSRRLTLNQTSSAHSILDLIVVLGYGVREVHLLGVELRHEGYLGFQRFYYGFLKPLFKQIKIQYFVMST